MEKKFEELKTRLAEIFDINMINSLLSWDQATYMPPGGAEAKGRQTAMLGKLSQEKLIDPAIGKLLDDLEPWTETLPPDSDEAALIRVTRIDFEQAIRIHADFIGELYQHFAKGYQAWSTARPENDFS